ncbi:MAG: hypothetical protein K1Y02_00890 [Candidatus Hydrogenedentes bacterium]|nr:hypothetical protein [Candidatus Hydrogenedentota bacterium]
MTLRKTILVGALCAGLIAVPVHAWGPKTQESIVTTAARVISNESGVKLDKLEKDLRTGASVSANELAEINPLAEADPIGAIESEMYLLQSVRGKRIDPYFAYRLGALGALVSRVTTPLAESNPTYRDLYYSDVDQGIEKARLDTRKRATVDPATYFSSLRSAIAKNEVLILNDYKSGLGFKGVAGASLSEDASRSVNAVADVLTTVLQSGVTASNTSVSQIRDYALSAVGFYIKRGNDTEADSSYKRLEELNALTPELQKQIGNMFYDAGKYERAMQEFSAVLAAVPGDREVSERIADYYIRVGDAALQEENLEAALDAYQKASEADKLRPDAQTKLLDAQRLIKDRDTRHEMAKSTVAEADECVAKAEQAEFNREFGEAMTLLAKAQDLYETVGDEFQQEGSKARAGLLAVGSKLGKLQQDLVSNAPMLSGKGVLKATQDLAVTVAQEQDAKALKALTEAQFEAEINRLKNESAELFKP